MLSLILALILFFFVGVFLYKYDKYEEAQSKKQESENSQKEFNEKRKDGRNPEDVISEADKKWENFK